MSVVRAFVLAAFLGACGDDGAPVIDAAVSDDDAAPDAAIDAPPDAPPGPHWAAIGGGLVAGTAGYGIDAASQSTTFVARLATVAGATYRIPSLAAPGCPAPGSTPRPPGACALTASAPFDALAVPGSRAIDIVDKPPSPSQLEILFHGVDTQAAKLATSGARFVVVDFSEEVLRPALAGDLGSSTAEPGLLDLATFRNRFNRVAEAVALQPNLEGVALLGVFDPVGFSPQLQLGAYYFLARDASGKFNGKQVNANCSPITQLGQPNPLGLNVVAVDIVHDAALPEINCDPAAYPAGDARRGKYLLDAQERAQIEARVGEYNGVIANTATNRGWAHVDVSAFLAVLYTEKNAQGGYPAMRKCQDVPAALQSGSAATIQQAVLRSCPVTGATGATPIFGSYFSLDATYPNADGHARLAGVVAAAINAKYGTSLPTTF